MAFSLLIMREIKWRGGAMTVASRLLCCAIALRHDTASRLHCKMLRALYALCAPAPVNGTSTRSALASGDSLRAGTWQPT
jgi:hypothetical protein